MSYSWRSIQADGGLEVFALVPADAPAGGVTDLISPGVVTTRRGGVSRGVFDGLNVSFRVGDEPASVRENRTLTARALGLESGSCTRPEQVHGGLVVEADSPGDYAGADGLVSGTAGLWLSVHVADCVPVFAFTPDLSAVGLAHAGRRGTDAGITSNLINVFKSAFQHDAGQLIVALGPSVGPCCYELDEKTASRLRADCVTKRGGRFFFDLWKANRLQAMEAGVLGENVVMPPACTSCRSDLLFSHRAHCGRTGRQMAITKPGGVGFKCACPARPHDR